MQPLPLSKIGLLQSAMRWRLGAPVSRSRRAPSGGSSRRRRRQGSPPVCAAHGPRELPHTRLGGLRAGMLEGDIPRRSVRRSAHDAPDAILIADATDLAVDKIDFNHVLGRADQTQGLVGVSVEYLG